MTAPVCSNCGEPVAEHECPHLIPHCPGKCPCLDLKWQAATAEERRRRRALRRMETEGEAGE